MPQADYDQSPESLTVRELRVGGKTLVTTLLCPKQTDKTALKSLYRDRWHVELDLRNIKTTPVSYTHLDVYKRQDRGWSKNPGNAASSGWRGN